MQIDQMTNRLTSFLFVVVGCHFIIEFVVIVKKNRNRVSIDCVHVIIVFISRKGLHTKWPLHPTIEQFNLPLILSPHPVETEALPYWKLVDRFDRQIFLRKHNK